MRKIVLRGPMVERTYVRGGRRITFEKGVPVEVDDDFAAELLAQNPDGLTPDEAAPYGVPVFGEAAEPEPPAEG